MQLQLLCRMSITGGTWAEHGSEGQEETGLGQEAKGKQLEGSLHSSCYTALGSASARCSQLPTSANTKHQLN